MASGQVRPLIARPVKAVPTAFLLVIIVGTVLLLLPAAHSSGATDPWAAAFTAVSAVCVTGLSTVDTATYWTPLGQVIILMLMQVGGFGIMSAATLIGLLLGGQMSLSRSLVTDAESHSRIFGNAKAFLRRIAVTMLTTEAVIAAVLTGRLIIGYGESPGAALWGGTFHSVASFTNAGFSTFSTGFSEYATDPWMVWPVCLAVIAGGLGFPVFMELVRHWRQPRRWTVHARITLWGYGILLVVGIGFFTLFEWGNPGTLGGYDPWGKLVAGVPGGVIPRTAGMTVHDYAQVRPETTVLTLILMFIGGGSAGTAGGIKVTTFFLLGLAILAEVRGEQDVTVGNRRIAPSTVRQALSVALLGVGTVTVGTMALVMMTDHTLEQSAFEVVSAFGTVGLSMGITSSLAWAPQLLLMVVMFVGRVGTVTAAASLAECQRPHRFRLPEERPIVG